MWRRRVGVTGIAATVPFPAGGTIDDLRGRGVLDRPVPPTLEADGPSFKDSNNNGGLDAHED